MSVTFRSTVDVDLVQTIGSDESIAHAAWVSTLGQKAEAGDPARIPGLINYLMRDKHGSPFEHNSFTFFIRCPIFVVREFHRHRVGWSYNEESGRYTKLKPEFYVPARERNLTQTGKPGHYVFAPGSDEQYTAVVSNLQAIAENAWWSYEAMLNAGVAKEVARMCLPLNIYTSFYATCNARSLMNFLSLRTEHEDALFPSHPQKEIQMVAGKMEEAFAATMPITYDAYVKNRRVAP